MSVKQASSLPTWLSRATGAGSSRSDLSGAASTAASSFTNILQKALINAADNKEGGQPSPAPPSPQEVNTLIFKMQQHFNDRLFRILTEDRSPERWQLKLDEISRPAFPAPDREASKFHHPVPKNDDLPAISKLEQIVGQAARTYGVDGDLIRSVIKAESNFDVRATSPRGAMGLMQLMPATARELGVQNPYDPRENIMGGTKYLKGLLDRYGGDRRFALAAYNWGMGNVEKSPERLPRETRDYVARVTGYYRQFQGARA